MNRIAEMKALYERFKNETKHWPSDRHMAREDFLDLIEQSWPLFEHLYKIAEMVAKEAVSLGYGQAMILMGGAFELSDAVKAFETKIGGPNE